MQIYNYHFKQTNFILIILFLISLIMEITNYYTAIQFANKKRVTKEAVYMAIYRGDLEATKIGRQWFILKTAKCTFQKRTYDKNNSLKIS